MMRSPKHIRNPAALLFLGLFFSTQIFFIFFKSNPTLDIDIYPNTHPSLTISGSRRIGQTFEARRDGLARIDVMFGTFGRNNDKYIFFRLWEMGTPRRLIAEVRFNASEVQNSLYFPIRFKPIKDSRGKTYSFILSSPKSHDGNAICVWLNEDNIYREGNLWIDGEMSQGDVIFRAYSKRTLFNELGRITSLYSGVLANRVLLIGILLIFELFQLFIFYKLLGLVLKPAAGYRTLRDR